MFLHDKVLRIQNLSNITLLHEGCTQYWLYQKRVNMQLRLGNIKSCIVVRNLFSSFCKYTKFFLSTAIRVVSLHEEFQSRMCHVFGCMGMFIGISSLSHLASKLEVVFTHNFVHVSFFVIQNLAYKGTNLGVTHAHHFDSNRACTPWDLT